MLRYILDNNKAVLYGITSWSVGCNEAKKVGVVFASVHPLVEFIQGLMVR